MIRRIRVYCPESHVPYENLALEYVMMRAAQPGECILTLWRNRRTVVIGRNQNLHAECRVEDLIADGGFPARRLSGGGAVFHDLGNLNFSFLVRDPDYDVDRQLSVIICALEEFGLHAEKTGRNDVAVDGRKCSGNAFLREGSARCHHGTLLISVKGGDMMRYLTPDPLKLQSKGVQSVRSRVVNLNDLEPALTVETVIPALIRAFEQVYGLNAEWISKEEIDWDAVRRKKEELQSEEWICGHDPACTIASPRMRFSWGSAQLSLQTEHGRVQNVVLHTDAMDETLPERAAKVFTGAVCSRMALLDALDESDLDENLQQDLQQMISSML